MSGKCLHAWVNLCNNLKFYSNIFMLLFLNKLIIKWWTMKCLPSFVCTCLCVFVCLCTCVCVCMCGNMCVCDCVCTHVCIKTSLPMRHACIHTCIYMHITQTCYICSLLQSKVGKSLILVAIFGSLNNVIA